MPKGAVPDWLADVEPAASPSRGPSASAPPSAAANINVELVALPPQAPLAASVSAPSGIQVGGFSSVGRVRDRNEDRFFAQHWTWTDGCSTHEGALLIVADGMGGYQAGDRASSTTIRVVSERLLLLPLQTMTGTGTEPRPGELLDAVVAALVEANRVVLEEANAQEKFKGMGATVAVALIYGGVLIVSHVGDCRVYLQRGGDVMQRTTDQTLVGRMVELGQLTPEEAESHPNRNEVLQAIGKRPGVEPSRQEERLLRGDRIVVACDGLDAHVSVDALRQLLTTSTKAPAELARQCVEMADEAGGSDNCTVVVASWS
jgi:protein phosphatase